MKKLATLLLLSTVALAGCSSIQRSLRGDDYVDSSLAAEESSKQLPNLPRVKWCFDKRNAKFPQLSKEVAEDRGWSDSPHKVKEISVSNSSLNSLL